MDSEVKGDPTRSPAPAEAGKYRICVSGVVEADWARSACAMEVAAMSEGTSELAGTVEDQSALLGVLRQLRDRNHDVLWLTRDDPRASDATGQGEEDRS